MPLNLNLMLKMFIHVFHLRTLCLLSRRFVMCSTDSVYEKLHHTAIGDRQQHSEWSECYMKFATTEGSVLFCLNDVPYAIVSVKTRT